ncbi:response regulator [Telmatospirillum sp.]|uniref:response regulator n=1 Tax=Telmatospirillum sp. TaxID=2079197 RepID=UPI0028489751|nr:response regulator [Telmatospirillum sp.]MDR3437460.1 response regulator [Telmatospirillum sp.]
MGSNKVLLVEDNSDDVELMLHAFKSGRIANDVDVVRDGESALDYLMRRGSFAGRDKSEQPALILLDLKLPGIDGLEVLRQIRANPDTKRIPVAILTTSDDEADIIRGYDLGVNSYIRKPVGFTAFTDMVEKLGLYWLVVNIAAPS